MKLVISFLFFLVISITNSQYLLIQDSFQGGVTGAGVNISPQFEAIYQFNVFLEPNSNIKKAFLIGGAYGEILQLQIELNSTPIVFNQSSVVTSGFFTYSDDYGFSQIHAVDVTQLIENTNNFYSLSVPIQDPNLGQSFISFYLIVFYENPTLSWTSSSVLLNNADSGPINNFNYSNLNPIDNIHDVSLAFVGHGFCNLTFDGTYVEVNNINLGLVGGDEFNSSFFCSGTQGHFYYQNHQLSALGDDISNNSVNGSDAIADIKNFLDYQDTSLSIDFIHQLPNTINAYTNPIVCTILSYTSPCQPFGASLLTSDTTVCAGVPLQLGASGGTSTGSAPPYEWLPQQNLSCYDCPNPVFLGDSTINYTVRIRNTDSCSVVYPVRVRVLPKPNFESLEITESVCGSSTGSITALPVSEVEPPHLFQLNGANTQLNEANYTNLAAGFYSITLTDGNACKRDSIVEIGEFNNVLADFSVNPSTGAAPLDIQISNQSQNATQYFWDFSDEDGNTISQTNGPFDSAQCPLAGVYTLTLIAGNGAEHCNDTTALQILVYDTLQVIVPNVFTPNNDGSNDWFGITANLDTELQIVLLNRWGNVMLEKQITLSANTFTPLWDGQNAPDGVYFYKIVLTAENKEMNGFVELRR